MNDYVNSTHMHASLTTAKSGKTNAITFKMDKHIAPNYALYHFTYYNTTTAAQTGSKQVDSVHFLRAPSTNTHTHTHIQSARLSKQKHTCSNDIFDYTLCHTVHGCLLQIASSIKFIRSLALNGTSWHQRATTTTCCVCARTRLIIL